MSRILSISVRFVRDLFERLHKALRQTDIRDINRLCEKRGDFFVPEAGNAAADTGDVEEEFWMFLGEGNEIINVRFDCFHSTLHGGNCVALATQTYTATHHGTEMPEGIISGSATVHTLQIAAKHKNLVRLQLADIVRGIGRTLDSIVFSGFFHIREDTKNSGNRSEKTTVQ